MAKTEKNKDENVKPLTVEQNKEALDNLKQLQDGKVVKVPSDAVINVPISGAFKLCLEETLLYILADFSTDGLLQTLHRVKTNFVGMKPGDLTLHDKSVWTLMTLINECNYRAADQKKTAVYDDPDAKELIADLLNGAPGSITELVKETDKLREEKFKEEPKEESKEDKSTEDSSQ